MNQSFGGMTESTVDSFVSMCEPAPRSGLGKSPAAQIESRLFEMCGSLHDPVVGHLLNLFLHEAVYRINQMREAVTAGQHAVFKSAAHTLADISHIIGADRLSRALGELEAFAETLSNVPSSVVSRVIDEYARARCVVESILIEREFQA